MSKVLHDNYITVATDVFLGVPVSFQEHKISYVGVKVPQFSFLKLKGADPVLRVEMRSTGEVASFDIHFRKHIFVPYFYGHKVSGEEISICKHRRIRCQNSKFKAV